MFDGRPLLLRVESSRFTIVLLLLNVHQLSSFLRLASGGTSSSFGEMSSLFLSFAEDLSESAGTIFAFFLTTTPLRVFLMSFFGATEGLGFAAALEADAVMDAVAMFAAAEVLAATALHNPNRL